MEVDVYALVGILLREEENCRVGHADILKNLRILGGMVTLDMPRIQASGSGFDQYIS